MTQPQTVLITGASSGIGLELARIFAEQHYTLILVARDRVALEALAAELHHQFLVKVKVEVCDLSNRAMLEEMIERFKREHQVIDILVNNAGFGVQGAFSESDWAMERSMLDVNIFALVRLTKAFLPQMVSRRSGRILQMSSLAAYQPGPFYSLYFASKAFVLSFSDAVGAELRGTGVTITTVCPGPTRTGFEKRLGPNPTLFASGVPIAEPAKVARFAYDALMAGRRLAIPGLTNRLLKWLYALIPQWFALFITVKILRNKS